ncbi:DUF4309 domain-containing protein [Pontibacillus yanchengensis]|uniref:DUF4309 domain-containing protein n=2 Tax=Pontibacillus yanchengensis TaxID=462910 RepID=A0ACC7VI06_9BACI|nr:DUF4309 domain-containing protein [Pontibacillus yanchengensis]MYL53806.1 DUF4309 domain-containing protein [Pontibacillus yanchengensis]
MALDKEWVITFNTSIEDTQSNKEAIYVTDETNTKIGTDVSIEEETITVTPAQNYESSHSYTLHIQESIMATSGKTIEQSISMPFTTKEVNPFSAGEWTRDVQHNGASLKITNVKDASFDFKIAAAAGGNAGLIEDTAMIKNGKATFDDGDGCTVTFSPKDNAISVETTSSCYVYGGSGVYFSGEYTKGDTSKETEPFVDMELFTSEENKTFKALVGEQYDLFKETFQLIYDEEVIDDFGGKAYSGMVRGLGGSMEGIVMNGDNGEIYAAILGTSSDGKSGILYYTTDKDYTNNIPKTIQSWRESMYIDTQLHYMNGDKEQAAYFDEEFVKQAKNGSLKDMKLGIGATKQEVIEAEGTDYEEEYYTGAKHMFYPEGYSYAYVDSNKDQAIQAVMYNIKDKGLTATDIENLLGKPDSEGENMMTGTEYVLIYEFDTGYELHVTTSTVERSSELNDLLLKPQS